jgi:hypothetical protein
MKTIKNKGWGGYRPRAGRPFKVDKDQWGQVTCVLRHDTIDMLRAGAASNRFGEFLQEHLDRYPPPTRQEYLALQQGRSSIHSVVRGVHNYKIIGHVRPPAMLKRIREIKRRRREEANLTEGEKKMIKVLEELAEKDRKKQERDRARKTNPRKSVARPRR